VLTASLPSWGEGLHEPLPETPGRRFERARQVLAALLAARVAGQAAVQAVRCGRCSMTIRRGLTRPRGS
jgi:hypothetical protein